MSFREDILGQPRPNSVRSVTLPRREKFFPSPANWQNEVLYFLLPDRFSDGREASRPLLDRANLPAARPAGFKFDGWAKGGGERWQGGTLRGIRSQLAYLRGLGVTAIWTAPVFKQRAHLNTFHGYAIQDFLDVDPRFGTRQDLVDLVDAAHQQELRVILDIVFNHSGCNWIYESGDRKPAFRPFPNFYAKGDWFDGDGARVKTIGPADTASGVWPQELQPDGVYTRAGSGDLGRGDLGDPNAEFRRSDFDDLRDFNYDGNALLSDLSRCYKYWIALTDCDGFRLDTLKHVSEETGRNFCGSIKEYATNLGKADFFLVGEVAGSDNDAARYREVLGRNLNATLDIGSSRRTLHDVAKGLAAPQGYLDFVSEWLDDLGTHRTSGERHVSILDDHDHVSGDKVRFSSDAASDHQVVAGVALQLFSLGIPCIYYGTEQAFAGPERALREQFLPDYNRSPDGKGAPPDKYLREAMFGPEHPLADGRGGFGPAGPNADPGLPGFGPFGTAGRHCFDTRAGAYVRIAALLAVRARFPVLRLGRQYQRPIANFQAPFALPPGGELIAWSRILDDEEALCIVNGHGTEVRGGDVLVDAGLNAGALGAPALFTVVANSAQAATTGAFAGSHPVGSRMATQLRGGSAFVAMRDVGPSEVIVLVNHT